MAVTLHENTVLTCVMLLKRYLLTDAVFKIFAEFKNTTAHQMSVIHTEYNINHTTY